MRYLISKNEKNETRATTFNMIMESWEFVQGIQEALKRRGQTVNIGELINDLILAHKEHSDKEIYICQIDGRKYSAIELFEEFRENNKKNRFDPHHCLHYQWEDIVKDKVNTFYTGLNAHFENIENQILTELDENKNSRYDVEFERLYNEYEPEITNFIIEITTDLKSAVSSEEHFTKYIPSTDIEILFTALKEYNAFKASNLISINCITFFKDKYVIPNLKKLDELNIQLDTIPETNNPFRDLQTIISKILVILEENNVLEVDISKFVEAVVYNTKNIY